MNEPAPKDHIVIHAKTEHAEEIHAWLEDIFSKQEKGSFTMTIYGEHAELVMYARVSGEECKEQARLAADATILMQHRDELREYLKTNFPDVYDEHRPPHLTVIDILDVVRQAARIGLIDDNDLKKVKGNE